jgi:D-arabinose 5-phosphate isomerase GutQ
MSDAPDVLAWRDGLIDTPRAAERALLAAQDAELGSFENARSVVIVGTGSAGLAARATHAMAAESCPVPVAVVTNGVLPAWLGPTDLVVLVDHGEAFAMSARVLHDASVRGASIAAVGIDGPLADTVRLAGGSTVVLPAARAPQHSASRLSPCSVASGSRPAPSRRSITRCVNSIAVATS